MISAINISGYFKNYVFPQNQQSILRALHITSIFKKKTLFTIQVVSLLFLFLEPNYLHSQAVCEDSCISSRAKLVSKLNNSRTLILVGTENSLFEYNELKENEDINSFILQDIFDLIDFSNLLETLGITEYTDLGRFFQKSGIPFLYPQTANMNSILSGSLNLREFPLDESLTNSEKILFLKKNPPEIFQSNTPVFNENKYATFLIKFLINKNYYYNYNKIYSSRDINLNYYKTNSLDLKENFKKIFPVSQSEFQPILKKIWNKNYSISPNFPGNGYGFIEYLSSIYPGFYSVSNGGEIFYINKELNEFIYIYNKNMNSTALLKALRIMLDEKYNYFEITDKNISTYSGKFISVSLPIKGYIYLYSIFHPIILDTEDSKIILYGFQHEPLIFEKNYDLLYSWTENKAILLSLILDLYGNPETIHLSLGKNTSLRKIKSEEYYNFILPTGVGFVYFLFVIFTHFKFFRKKRKFIKLSLLIRIKILFFMISMGILLFIFSIIFFLYYGKFLPLKIFGYFLLSLNGIISLLSSVVLFFIYQFLINIRGNIPRKIKYGFFLVMVFFYYFFLFKLHLVQFNLEGVSLP